MSTKARAFLVALADFEAAIELPAASKLRQRKVNKAYADAPARAAPLNDVPCFVNWIDQMSPPQRMGNFVETQVSYEVAFYAPATDEGARYPNEYLDALITALHGEEPAAERFGGACDFFEFSGERPMVAAMEWNNLFYPGFRLYLQATFFEVV